MAERWKYRRGVRKAQFFKLAEAKRLPCGTELSSEVPTGSELRLLELLEAVTDTNCHLQAIEELLKKFAERTNG